MPASLAFWVHGLSLPLAALLLTYAALHDIAVRTIPNAIPVALAALGLALRLAEGGLTAALLAPALIGLCLAPLWLRGLLGGGDVKLFTALALVLPTARILPATVITAWTGALLALPYWASRARIAPPAARRPSGFVGRVCRAERFRLRRGGPLPYAVAIAAGGLFGLFVP